MVACTLIFLAEGKEYELLGSADGERFVLHSKLEGRTARLDGEDATRFRNDYDTVTTQYPGWKADQTLAQLWDQGGYSWLAVEDAKP